VQRLGLIDHGLQRDRVRNEFIVNDGFLLICGVVGPKMTAAAKGQMLQVRSRPIFLLTIVRLLPFHRLVGFR
jgi:hypothetical protein